MTKASGTRVEIASRKVPSRGSIALSARLAVTIEAAETVVDLTPWVRQLVEEAKVSEGDVHIHCGHTTCGLIVNKYEDLLAADINDALERLIPNTSIQYYAHDKQRSETIRATHGDRPNGHTHARAWLVTHPELTIPITDSALYLGTWQSIMLTEYDGPRDRELLVRVHGSTSATA
ncbi:secondary thiamine-phosphate synthase enzyme YjbQ [Streptomyces sp. NPDC054871]